ncbi:MAG: lytic transglycosylase domain-containing protein [Solirubrobacterales bacterium]
MRDRGLWALAAAGLIIAGIVFAISRINLDDAIREVTLPLRHDDIIRQQAERFDLDPALIAGIIYTESRFQDQTSSAGARGLMQITPETADTIETLSGGETFVFEDLANPELNIRYGTFYLDHLLDRFGGNTVAALAGYNGGPENVVAWGGAELEVDDIEFPETKNYVLDVLERRDEYDKNYGDELGL